MRKNSTSNWQKEVTDNSAH